MRFGVMGMCVMKEYLAGGLGAAGYDDIHHPVLTGEQNLPPVSLVCGLWGDIRRGGVLRYPSPSTDRGVGPPAGIFVYVWYIGVADVMIEYLAGGIWRYPSPGTDRGVGPPDSIYNVCAVGKYPAGGAGYYDILHTVLTGE